MPEWVIERTADGDVSGGILLDQIVAWEVTQWPPEDNEEDDYHTVGFWLQGDYRMVEPGVAPMHLNLTAEEYEGLVSRLQFGPRPTADPISPAKARLKSKSGRGPKKPPDPVTPSEQEAKTNGTDGDGKVTAAGEAEGDG